MDVPSTLLQPRLRTGTVGAYTSGSDLELVRRARATVGRVTVSGKSGLTALGALSREGDLWGVDLDPARYLDREPEPEALFPLNWVALQRDLGLPIVRSAGTYVPRGDGEALRTAFGDPLPADTVRVVSLHGWWLRREGLIRLLPAVHHCDDPLAIALADAFDPLDAVGAVDGLCAVMDAAGQRRLELVRTDTTGIAFAAAGGSLGAVGLTASTRHHGLPLGKRAGLDYEERQRSPLVFTRAFVSWHRGIRLGALRSFRGAGITDCPCSPCDGRGLLRFDHEWPRRVPSEVAADAREHDLHGWAALARDILAAADPLAEWRATCQSAVTATASIADIYKVSFTLPRSVTDWL